MVILESRDMVELADDRPCVAHFSWDPKYNWDRMDGYKFGVWAGDLAYHDGRWYCYQIDTTNGLYMSSSSDIRGPWTEPHLMLRKNGWTDPAVYWDDEGKQAYLVCNFGPAEPKEQGNRTPAVQDELGRTGVTQRGKSDPRRNGSRGSKNLPRRRPVVHLLRAVVPPRPAPAG